MPWDSAYEGSVSAAHTKYNNALAGIGAARLSTEQEYGLDPGFNDLASNPYSRAAELQQSYKRNDRGSLTSMGSAGHLYSGALQNQLGYNRSDYDREGNSLRTEYQRALQGLREKELAAGDEMREAEGDAAWRRVEAAEREPLDPSIASGDASQAGAQHAYLKTKKGKKKKIEIGGARLA